MPLSDKWRNRLLNGGLLIAVGAVTLLLYAFGAYLVAPDTNPHREANPANLLGDVIQVEVRNGCGVPDVASKVTEYLREKGFDVVRTGNFESFNEDSSRVIDRVGNVQAAEKVATVLGLSKDRVAQQVDESYYLDVSVVIGADYHTLQPFEE